MKAYLMLIPDLSGAEGRSWRPRGAPVAVGQDEFPYRKELGQLTVLSSQK